MSTPSHPSNPEHGVHAEQSVDPVAINIQAALGSEQAANTGSSRTLDNIYDLRYRTRGAFLKAVDKVAASIKKTEDDIKALQAKKDLRTATLKQLAGSPDVSDEMCNEFAATFKGMQEDINTLQATLCLMKAFLTQLRGMADASQQERARLWAEWFGDMD